MRARRRKVAKKKDGKAEGTQCGPLPSVIAPRASPASFWMMTRRYSARRSPATSLVTLNSFRGPSGSQGQWLRAPNTIAVCGGTASYSVFRAQARTMASFACRQRGLRYHAAAFAARWTLKRVQGDEALNDGRRAATERSLPSTTAPFSAPIIMLMAEDAGRSRGKTALPSSRNPDLRSSSLSLSLSLSLYAPLRLCASARETSSVFFASPDEINRPQPPPDPRASPARPGSPPPAADRRQSRPKADARARSWKSPAPTKG